MELRGDLVAIEPLYAEHATALLAAADSEEVFAWLPYPRPTDSAKRRIGSRAPSMIDVPTVGFRLRSLRLGAVR